MLKLNKNMKGYFYILYLEPKKYFSLLNKSMKHRKFIIMEALFFKIMNIF